MPIRKDWIEFTPGNVAQAPEVDGVYELADGESNIIYIKGTANLRQSLEENLKDKEPCLTKVRYYRYEETFMYTLRESELMQQFIRKNSRMPEGNLEVI